MADADGVAYVASKEREPPAPIVATRTGVLTMGCGCAGNHAPSAEDAARKSAEVLDRAGLRGIFEQARTASAVASGALEQLARAERADALEFGEDVVRLHRDRAQRENRRATRQFAALIDRIDARRRDDDWRELSARFQSQFGEHDGEENLGDARADVRTLLLEQDPGLGAEVSREVLDLFDQVVERARRDGLDALLDLLRRNCKIAVEGFASEQMGRQPAVHGVYYWTDDDARGIAGGQDVNGWCVATAVCYATAVTGFVTGTVLCTITPFCWCCFYHWLLITLGLQIAACLAMASQCR